MALQKDLKEFLQLLIEKNVEFVIVGAHAVAHYGYPRLTGDIDIFFSPADDNVNKLLDSLNLFGFDFTKEQLSTPDKVFQMGLQPNRIDLLNWLSGVTFDEVWLTKVQGAIDDLVVYFISKQLLLKNKLASGRSKDLLDIEMLNKI